MQVFVQRTSWYVCMSEFGETTRVKKAYHIAARMAVQLSQRTGSVWWVIPAAGR